MTKFTFFRLWLFVVSIGIAVFGLVLALFPQSWLMDFLLNSSIDPVFWGDGIAPQASVTFQAWAYGVLGATISGWGVLMAFVIHMPFKARRRWAWTALAVSSALWYIVDTSLSAFYGVNYNVWFNTALLILVAVPLAFTYNNFSSQAD